MSEQFDFGLPEWLTGATPDTGRTDEYGMSWEALSDHAYAYACQYHTSDVADEYGIAFANYWFGHSDSADHTKDVSRAMLAEAVKRKSWLYIGDDGQVYAS